MRTVVNCVNTTSSPLNFRHHPLVNFAKRAWSNDAFVDAGLVCDDNKTVSGIRETLNCSYRIRDEFKFVPTLDIVIFAIVIDYPISIKKDGLHAAPPNKSPEKGYRA